MPKIRVTMEAEVGDLNTYYPDDPVGATRANVIDTIARMQTEIISMQLMNESREDKDAATYKWTKECYRQELEFARRLLKTCKVEILPEQIELADDNET